MSATLTNDAAPASRRNYNMGIVLCLGAVAGGGIIVGAVLLSVAAGRRFVAPKSGLSRPS